MSQLHTIKKILSKIREFIRMPAQIMQLKDLVLFEQTRLLQRSHSNPLNRFGKKCFSQSDEDGITLEILRRINRIDAGVYAEFGVGDGTENNTLILAALGWKGFWVGGERLRFDGGANNQKRFSYLMAWITLENIVDLARRGLKEIDAEELDVISLDLDGNDIYFVEKLLANGFRPKLFVVEYNAKFPPPVRFQIAYNPGHTWKGDDYFGASLASFSSLFSKFSYRLICCNSHTGANAFFVDSSFSECFADVPADMNQIYAEPRYYFYNMYGHSQSIETIRTIFGGN